MYIPIEGGAAAHSARRARARRALVGQLKRADALGYDRAIDLVANDRTEEKVLGKLIARGVIRPGLKGGYWLDAERYAEDRRQGLIFVVGVVLVMAGFVTCMLLYAPHHPHRHTLDTDVVFPLP